MDFKDQVRELGKRVTELKEHTQTEEATKNAFVMPFLNLLGFNVFNPLEVKPEFVADVGLKKGEKIDYAIFKDGEIILLVECKHWQTTLNINNESQLLRYYHVSKSKFALLTNGIEYRFYSDLDEPNIMDKTPFLAFDITKIKDNQIAELKKFSKVEFDLDKIAASASELKYTSAMRAALVEEFTEPSEGLVRHFAGRAYAGRLTQNVMEQFTRMFKKTLDQYLSDLITDRFKSAIESEKAKEEEQKKQESEEKIVVPEDGIVTTEEELEGYAIVKAIVCQKVKAARVAYRDAKSYFAVLLDDNSRKPICRLYYNGRKKSIGLFNDPKNFQGYGGKEDTRFELPEINPNEGIYNYATALLQTVDYYEHPESVPKLDTSTTLILPENQPPEKTEENDSWES
ncbi:MAG: type I restriction endonuclease [Planctomycetia bacterium]|nr:type I restriction endonuclease [Planctomycetia bacterium]